MNVTSEQIVSNTFGVVGQSGFGSYHGQVGFDEFSDMRNILFRRTTALPMMMIPSAMQLVKNAFPTWAHGLLKKKVLKPHLFLPSWGWLKHMAMICIPVGIGLLMTNQNAAR